jgi:hypothetical protein
MADTSAFWCITIPDFGKTHTEDRWVEIQYKVRYGALDTILFTRTTAEYGWPIFSGARFSDGMNCLLKHDRHINTFLGGYLPLTGWLKSKLLLDGFGFRSLGFVHFVFV